MEEPKIKNRIITISGEPVSGKGTVLKELSKKLEEQGFQTHIVTTGTIFRSYYKLIIDFILALNSKDEEKLKELSKSAELQEIFSSEENRQKIMRLSKKDVDFSSFKIVDANDNPAYAEVTGMLDGIVDNRSKQLGEEINSKSRPNEVWIIDSRLAFHNIKEAFAVRLTTNKEVAGKRLFNDNTRGKADQYKTLEQATETREARRIAEIERYREKYNIDITDENKFDLLIDTSYSSIQNIADVILGTSKNYYDNKAFAKKWASPKIFLPLQEERETLGAGSESESLQHTIDSIKGNGYYLDSAIEVLESDGIKYIYEGHHRNFALAYVGGTLIPYNIIARDDETIGNSGNTARQRAEGLKMAFLYGHEALIEHGTNGKFSYSDIYPELVQKLKAKENKESPDEDEFPM